MSKIQVVGDWEVLERIGVGAFSIVWKARHRKTTQLAAVKEIATAKLSADFTKCLDAELAAMREMNHPNIVSFYELIKEPGRMYIVMEYCQDGELQEVIQRGRCSEQFTQRCMAQLAAGLKALRKAKIIHRDLKPANLLLADGALKIADFGFARSLPSENLADTLCGSPLYMAPEVLQRKKYDARADLWSVGVIMYEMLVGKAPFEGQNYIHLLHNIESKPLIIPKSIATRVSKHCLDLLARLLQRDPHKRIEFDAFFRHPFIKTPLPEEPPPPSPKPPTVPPETSEENVPVEEGEEEFSYTFDQDFVVVNRIETITEVPEEVEVSEHEAHLLRVAEWVLEYSETSLSKVQAFFLALISSQILQHLDKRIPSRDPILNQALAKAQALSDDIDGAFADQKCSALELYEVLYKDAVVCAQKAAADELCGQFYDSRESYFRSMELLTFLASQGAGVPLTPPLKLPQDQIDQLTSLIDRIKQRRDKCAPITRD